MTKQTHAFFPVIWMGGEGEDSSDIKCPFTIMIKVQCPDEILHVQMLYKLLPIEI